LKRIVKITYEFHFIESEASNRLLFHAINLFSDKMFTTQPVIKSTCKALLFGANLGNCSCSRPRGGDNKMAGVLSLPNR